MTLQASGAISFSDLQTEFGGSNPIGMNEYYKDGSYVSSGFSGTGTASSMSFTQSNNSYYGSGSIFWRYYENGSGPLPTINTSTQFYVHAFWTDQAWTSGTGWVDTTMTIDQAGDYKVKLSGYNTGASRTLEVWIDGVKETTLTSLNSTYSFSKSGEFTLRLYSTMTTVGNYNQHVATVTSSTDDREISYTLNENIPTSGVVSMDDFYNGQGI